MKIIIIRVFVVLAMTATTTAVSAITSSRVNKWIRSKSMNMWVDHSKKKGYKKEKIEKGFIKIIHLGGAVYPNEIEKYLV